VLYYEIFHAMVSTYMIGGVLLLLLLQPWPSRSNSQQLNA